jgi:hypothetical protein
VWLLSLCEPLQVLKTRGNVVVVPLRLWQPSTGRGTAAVAATAASLGSGREARRDEHSRDEHAAAAAGPAGFGPGEAQHRSLAVLVLVLVLLLLLLLLRPPPPSLLLQPPPLPKVVV